MTEHSGGTGNLLSDMPKRPLGRTGWKASVLTMGGVKWDSHIPEPQAIELIHRAMELGVNTFDTAHAYANGQSEVRLGKALAGRRQGLWVSTKTDSRSYDGARKQMDLSLKRLQMDHVDLMLMHGIGDDTDYAAASSPDGVLKALDEYRKAGHIRFIGVSGHHWKHNMLRIVQEYPFDAILVPVGLFNLAYDYSYFQKIIPLARAKGMAVMGMKVFGAGRVKHAASREPYLRYSLNQPIDTAVIGCDSIEQLEETVRYVKGPLPALSQAEQAAMVPEIMQITGKWDAGEFNWVQHYRHHRD